MKAPLVSRWPLNDDCDDLDDVVDEQLGDAAFFISFPPPLKSPIHVSLLPMSRWGEVGMNRGDGRNEADIQKAKLIIFTV